MRWSRLAYSSREEFLSWTSSQLKEAAAAGTLKTERVITSPQRSSVSVAGRSKPLLNFCANNYLGLSAHPKVVAAARSALDTHGFGMSSVRFICGTQDIHKELERRLARFHDMEDAILFGSAFDANGGIFEVLLTGEEDVVISDELNHASIIDGIRLCKATRKRYKHRDTGQLEQLLGEGSGTTRRVLVVTDGVFSMDGTVAPLREIVASAKRSGALVMVDECHATGFLGRGGKGTPTLENSAQPDIISSTLGKALGGATGGYVAGPASVVALLRQRARPYLFSNSVAPCVVAAGLAALDIVEGEEGLQLRNRLVNNVASFRAGMLAAGFAVGGDPRHAICPVHIGDAAKATQAAARLQDHGIFVVGFSYPVVPLGKARIRVQISAAHSPQDVEQAVAAFAAVKKEFGI